MPIAHLDVVDTSSVQIQGLTGGRVVRGGYVEGLPTSGVDPADVLFAATTATNVPPQGTPHPTRSNFILSGVGVYGVSVDTARIELIYEPFGSSTGVSYVIEIGSSVSTYESNMIPKTKQPIAVSFKSVQLTTPPAVPPPIPRGLVTMTMLRPLVRVIVTQLRTGSLDVAACAAFADNAGTVNSATWLNKPRGAWLVTSASALVSRFSGYYQTRLEATRQGDDLWSYYGILQNQETGKFAYDLNTGSYITSLVGRAYAPQSIFPADGTGTDGVVRVDPYAAQNFTTLFGF